MAFQPGYRLLRGEEINAAIAAAVKGDTGDTGATGATGAAGSDASVTVNAIKVLDFSTLPTSDPGSGKLWLNGGVLTVGAGA